MTEWISVEEGLPESPKYSEGIITKVIVWSLDYGEVGFFMGHYSPGLKKWKIEGSPSDWVVTHWMIPEPPEEKP